MRNIHAIYIRELRSYFVSPIFYILAFVFLLVMGNSFKDSFLNFATQTARYLVAMRNYGGTIPLINVNHVVSEMFKFMNFLFLFIVPLLTMRLYAEEKKNGTMELLMTSPITTTQVLLGKFLSCLTIFVILMLLTISFNIIMMIQSGGKLDWGPVLSSYLGTFLFGTTLIAIGMFFSSLTENQIVAASLTVTFSLGLWLLIVTSRLLSPPFNQIIRYIAISEHLDSFIYGFVGLHHITYFLSMTTLWLFLTGITVESARWRQ